MIFRDLTPFERKDEQVRLRDRLAALGQMAAGLAHEIRNPLAGMEVLAGLLKRRLAGDSKERELVTELIGELRAVAATVTQSLDFVRPVPPARAPIDLVNLLETSLGQALSRHPFNGVIERSFAADSAPLVGDAEQIQVVVTNLILNALEAMEGSESPRLKLGFETHVTKRAGASVRLQPGEAVDAGRPGAAAFRTDTTRADTLGVDESAGEASPESLEVVISVADNGPGVPNAIREKVFYPFFSTKECGSGVGLATAQKFVLSHGGTIEVGGRYGEGCTFRVNLPAGTDFEGSTDGVPL
jgi:signal transduction histidine kinase